MRDWIPRGPPRGPRKNRKEIPNKLKTLSIWHRQTRPPWVCVPSSSHYCHPMPATTHIHTPPNTWHMDWNGVEWPQPGGKSVPKSIYKKVQNKRASLSWSLPLAGSSQLPLSPPRQNLRFILHTFLRLSSPCGEPVRVEWMSSVLNTPSGPPVAYDLLVWWREFLLGETQRVRERAAQPGHKHCWVLSSWLSWVALHPSTHTN